MLSVFLFLFSYSLHSCYAVENESSGSDATEGMLVPNRPGQTLIGDSGISGYSYTGYCFSVPDAHRIQLMDETLAKGKERCAMACLSGGFIRKCTAINYWHELPKIMGSGLGWQPAECELLTHGIADLTHGIRDQRVTRGRGLCDHYGIVK